MAPVKKDDPGLPPPWQALFEPTQNLTYYWDPTRNITQYERPAGAAPVHVAAPAPVAAYAPVCLPSLSIDYPGTLRALRYVRFQTFSKEFGKVCSTLISYIF